MRTDITQSPESVEVLGNHPEGWFGEVGTKDMMQVANAPYNSRMKFEDMFVCDPSAKHMGFKSWDGKQAVPLLSLLFVFPKRMFLATLPSLG